MIPRRIRQEEEARCFTPGSSSMSEAGCLGFPFRSCLHPGQFSLAASGILSISGRISPVSGRLHQRQNQPQMQSPPNGGPWARSSIPRLPGCGGKGCPFCPVASSLHFSQLIFAETQTGHPLLLGNQGAVPAGATGSRNSPWHMFLQRTAGKSGGSGAGQKALATAKLHPDLGMEFGVPAVWRLLH